MREAVVFKLSSAYISGLYDLFRMYGIECILTLWLYIDQIFNHIAQGVHNQCIFDGNIALYIA